jgi:hypothetical protein
LQQDKKISELTKMCKKKIKELPNFVEILSPDEDGNNIL